MRSSRAWVSICVILIGIEFTKCDDCNTFFECASGFFNDFVNRFASVNAKSTEYLPTVKNFTLNGSAFNGFHIESSDESFDKLFPNSIHSIAKDFDTNGTGVLELLKIDLVVPNVNTTVIIKNIKNDLDVNGPGLEIEKNASKTGINAEIPFSIIYENKTVSIEHDNFTEIFVKKNIVNTEDSNAEDRLHSLYILDEILRDYENDFPDNSTDYQTVDYVEVYADRIVSVDENESTLQEDRHKDSTNHTTESKEDFENFIEYFDEKRYNDGPDKIEGIKKEAALSRNVTSIKNATKLRNCGEDEFEDDTRDSIFHWTASIFLKLSNHTDFGYACDAVIVSERYVVTARKCFNRTTSKDDILLVTGKRSLRNIGEREAAYKIEGLVYQNGTEESSLAILETETDIEFNEFVESACVPLLDNVTRVNRKEALAIGYNATGDLSVISLVNDLNGECLNEDSGKDNATTKLMLCMRVRHDDTACPNLGNVYVSKSTVPSKISLLGILTDRPEDCHRKLTFTLLHENMRWIEENVKS